MTTLPIPPRRPLPASVTATRAELAEAFRAAKTRLWDGTPDHKGSTFICLALERAAGDAYFNAKAVVESRLGSWGTYGAWLDDQIGGDAVGGLYQLDLQQARHAWLDDLIAEFSE